VQLDDFSALEEENKNFDSVVFEMKEFVGAPFPRAIAAARHLVYLSEGEILCLDVLMG